VVEVSHALGAVDAAFLDRCKVQDRWAEQEARVRYDRQPFDEPMPDLAALLPAPKTITLEFVRGPSSKLAPSSASQKAISDMQPPDAP
jgi:hypothetical protein